MKEEGNIVLNMKKLFNALYKGEKSQSFRDIFRKIYGDDYPEEADHDSFVTTTTLQNFVRYLNVGPGLTFVDLGCGRGGPGMWIARETGANYAGIDLSEIGVEMAEKRAIDFGIHDKVSFQTGNICATDFSDNYFDGAISIDVLGFIPDKLAAVNEIARILHSDALFVFTDWENKKSVNDFQPVLRKAGFKVEVYNEIPDWERRQREVYQAVIDSKKILIKDMGREGAFAWIMEAKTFLPELKNMRHIFSVAKKL